MNKVKIHTKSSVHSYLRIKRSIISCSYNAPCQVHDNSIMFIDEKGKNKYEAAWNYDRLNVQNVDLLRKWQENVDFQELFLNKQF